MIARAMLWLATMVAAGSMPARALDLRQRSESGDKQFIVYSEDVRLRQRVAGFAEDVKAQVVQLLGQNDRWRAPVVITLARATTLEQGEPAARLRLAETQPGFKIEIQVKIGDDPTVVHLHKVILKALLMEYAYRQSGVTAGQPIVEPPWWVVEGMLAMARRQEQSADNSVFRRLVETNHLPAIGDFLAEKPDEMGPTALAVNSALAMGLLEMLVELPDGRANLARLVREWPQSNGDPAALLARHFPSVGSGPTLQKWWTLNLAHFAVEDRFQGLSAEETEKALTPLLQVAVTIDKEGSKEGDKKSFALADYAALLKLPAGRQALTIRHNDIISLSTRANVLYRPVMADYEEIFSLLSHGKTHGMRDRLARAEEYRHKALKRATEIADYLNWFEATQMKTRSGLFDDYLKTVDEISERERKQKGLVGQYLDELEKDL